MLVLHLTFPILKERIRKSERKEKKYSELSRSLKILLRNVSLTGTQYMRWNNNNINF